MIKGVLTSIYECPRSSALSIIYVSAFNMNLTNKINKLKFGNQEILYYINVLQIIKKLYIIEFLLTGMPLSCVMRMNYS